jgi:hypothetical protein
MAVNGIVTNSHLGYTFFMLESIFSNVLLLGYQVIIQEFNQ